MLYENNELNGGGIKRKIRLREKSTRYFSYSLKKHREVTDCATPAGPWSAARVPGNERDPRLTDMRLSCLAQ